MHIGISGASRVSTLARTIFVSALLALSASTMAEDSTDDPNYGMPQEPSQTPDFTIPRVEITGTRNPSRNPFPEYATNVGFGHIIQLDSVLITGSRGKQPGDNNSDPCLKTANPVLLATGEKYKEEPDIVSNSPYGLSLTRTYRSLLPINFTTMFGSKWISTYDYPQLIVSRGAW